MIKLISMSLCMHLGLLCIEISHVRMLKMIGFKHNITQALDGEMGSTMCRCLHELLGMAIRSFLMSYIKELKVRTRQN